MEIKMKKKRMQWYLDAKLGMFIHWGIYSVYGHGEWARSYEEISIDEYQNNFDNFDPKNYNPKAWAELAKNAGMKYAVLTAKHHDGFCLFDSKYTDYKSKNTKLNRDVVADFVEAFRSVGIKIGLYYSLLDWHHPDFPAYGDMYAPMRNRDNSGNKGRNFDRYLQYLHNQVEELCTHYGKLDLFWFDFSYDKLQGEAWNATELVRMIKSHHPDIIINNRLDVNGGGLGSIVDESPKYYCGDFITPEQTVPEDGFKNFYGESVPWETCITTNNHWGYCKDDKNFKSGKTLIIKLVDCVSRGGNLLINIGPDGNGVVPEEAVKALNELGAWVKENSESIYGCGISGLNKPNFGRITKKGNKYYYHLTEEIIGPIPLPGISKQSVKKITLLINQRELFPINTWIVNYYDDIVFVSLGEQPDFTYRLPDDRDTVICVEVN